MLDNLIKFELTKLLGRDVKNYEFSAAVAEINDNAGLVSEWQDIRDILETWRDNNYFKCLGCGLYYPMDEKQTVNDEFDDGYYYCNDCISDAREGAKFDPHVEWGTDNRHTC